MESCSGAFSVLFQYVTTADGKTSLSEDAFKSQSLYEFIAAVCQILTRFRVTIRQYFLLYSAREEGIILITKGIIT